MAAKKTTAKKPTVQAPPATSKKSATSKAVVKSPPAKSGAKPTAASKSVVKPPVAKSALGAAKKVIGPTKPRTKTAAVATPPARRAAGKPTPDAVLTTYQALRRAHPDAHCELDHRSAFELVVATALSAQATDVSVNKATPELFRRFPTPEALARASQEDVESCINRIGMYRQKAKNIIGLSKIIVEKHGGQVPRTQAELVELPGVGRKTANVVLGVAFGTPEGVVVDTHVQRISQRLGWTEESTPEKIERDLMTLFPRSEWDMLSHTLIFHGRRICAARKPSCSTCPVNDRCPSAFHAEDVGRKPARVR